MAVMRGNSLRSIVEPLLNDVFDGRWEAHEEQWSKAFDERKPIDRSVHEEPVISDLAAAQLKPNGEPYFEDAGSEAYTARYVFNTYGVGFAMTEELVEDGEHISIGSTYSADMADSLREAQELVAADYLNRGFTALASGGSSVGDGVPLFSASHPNVSGLVGSNLGTAASLSEASLEAMLIQMMNFQSQKGLRKNLDSKKLIIPTAQLFVAQRLLNSTLQPGTANNAINVINQSNMFPEGILVMNRLTSTTAYFIKTNAPRGGTALFRRKMRRGMEGDFRTGNLQYKCTSRFAFGATNWSGFYGNAGL